MGFAFHCADGTERMSPATDGAVETLLIELQQRANAKLRKRFGLRRSALLVHALAKGAGLSDDALAPLARLSNGMYTKEDYLAQFSEDWEIEEYGEHADGVIAANLAAWHPIAAYRAVLALALDAVAKPSLVEQILPDYDGGSASAIAALRDLEQRVAAATEAGAIDVCVTIDDLD